jgi:hypothetical protein
MSGSHETYEDCVRDAEQRFSNLPEQELRNWQTYLRQKYCTNGPTQRITALLDVLNRLLKAK